MVINWLAVFILLTQLASPIFPRFTQEQENPSISDLQAIPEFGQQITFQARIEPSENVEKVVVYITPAGQPTVWEEMQLDQQGQAVLEVDVRRLRLVPFSTINYRLEAILVNGESVTSESLSFQYEDTRFNWQQKTSGIFQVSWYGEDATLGQEMINISEAGLEQAQEILAVDPPALIRIYAYTSSRDLQSALQLAGQSWVAGHASPELGMILISVPSGLEKKLELQRQIPHEIMHLLQYQFTGNQYPNYPAWLLEGMASLVEVYPNPEYQSVLKGAAQENDLLPMESLCASFPPEASPAFNAYAQSESFVGFLYRNYGASELRDLMAQYQNGLGCKEGVAAVYNASLSQLEKRWKQEALGVNPGELAMHQLSPYLLLGLLILIPATLAFLPTRSAKK